MIDFTFRIPGPLMGWMRPSRGKYGNVYDPPEQVAYKRMVGLLCRQAMMKTGLFCVLDGPLSFGFEALFPHPKKRKPQRYFKDSKPDLDNLIKNVKDALKGIAWTDDQQVAYYGRCAKWFMPPDMPGDGYAWVTIGEPPLHEHPFYGPAGAIPRDAGQHGPQVQGRAGPHHQKGNAGSVAS